MSNLNDNFSERFLNQNVSSVDALMAIINQKKDEIEKLQIDLYVFEESAKKALISSLPHGYYNISPHKKYVRGELMISLDLKEYKKELNGENFSFYTLYGLLLNKVLPNLSPLEKIIYERWASLPLASCYQTYDKHVSDDMRLYKDINYFNELFGCLPIQIETNDIPEGSIAFNETFGLVQPYLNEANLLGTLIRSLPKGAKIICPISTQELEEHRKDRFTFSFNQYRQSQQEESDARRQRKMHQRILDNSILERPNGEDILWERFIKESDESFDRLVKKLTKKVENEDD